jgi:histone-lysine N-methyltransferase ASH1L
LKDKQQRAKELEEKRKAENSPKKATLKKIISKKRKVSDEDESDASPKGKKRKMITTKAIKAGVKKAVATVRGKKNTKTTTKVESTTAGKSKANVKLPSVKATGRIKATVRAPRSTKAVKATKTTKTTKATKTTKQTTASPAKKTASQLKRPSAETKKKILDAASKGSGTSPRKPYAKKALAKSPVKAKMPAPKAKGTAKGSFGKGVKQAARRVVKSVKGAKK